MLYKTFNSKYDNGIYNMSDIRQGYKSTVQRLRLSGDL